MKIKLVPGVLVFAASALIALGFYSWCRQESLNLLVAIFGGISLCLSFGSTFAVSMEQSRTTVNIRVLSGVFALLLLISNIVFCCVPTFSPILYVIVNGLILLTWLSLCYAINHAMK